MSKRLGPRGPKKRPAPAPAVAAKRLLHLRAWRVRKNLTLVELAEASGLSVGFVSQLETLQAGFSGDTLDALATALGIATADLLRAPPDETVRRINDIAEEMTPKQREALLEWAEKFVPPKA